MANTTEKEKAEIKRNHESDMKNQKAGAPWGLKVNKISKKALAKKMSSIRRFEDTARRNISGFHIDKKDVKAMTKSIARHNVKGRDNKDRY